MNELEKSIDDILSKINKIKNISDKISNPDLSKHFKDNCSVVSKLLSLCLNAYSMRSNAFAAIYDIKSQIKGNEDRKIDFPVQYLNLDIPMSNARLLSTTTYFAACWSFYDTLQKAIFYLLCYWSNKIDEKNCYLYKEKSCFKYHSCYFEFHNIYKDFFFFSYRLRNLFIHNSGSINSQPIYTGVIFAETFNISDETSLSINNILEENRSFSAKSGDLIEQIETANNKIDAFFVLFLNYSFNCFALEIKNYVNDDKILFELTSIL